MTNQTFAVGHCIPCEASNLSYVDIAPDGSLLRRCIACNEPMRETELQTVAHEELGDYGYSVVEPTSCGSGCSAGGCRPPSAS